MRMRRLESKLRLTKKTRNWRSKKQVKRVKKPVICCFRPELINFFKGVNSPLESNP
jgi:hypothetical protein